MESGPIDHAVLYCQRSETVMEICPIGLYCDVFDWRPSLLCNRSRNNSMDTLTTPVLLLCMVTNSGNASVPIVAGTVLKREDSTQS
jgi:hypothetical protein